MIKPFFTFLTPTVNCVAILRDTYEDLCQQSLTNFEWIIVNDGRTDESVAIVTEWIQTALFPIHLLNHPHGKRFRAINVGMVKAQGILVIIGDHPMRYLPKTLETLYQTWITIPEEKRDHYVGLMALCRKQWQNKLNGHPFPHPSIDATLQELRFVYRRDPDNRVMAMRTDLYRRLSYPYANPDIPWLPISVVQQRIEATYPYRYRCINVVLGITPCHKAAIIGKPNKELAPGKTILSLMLLENELVWFWRRPGYFFGLARKIVQYGTPVSLLTCLRRLPLPARVLIGVMLPFGLIDRLRDKLGDRKRKKT